MHSGQTKFVIFCREILLLLLVVKDDFDCKFAFCTDFVRGRTVEDDELACESIIIDFEALDDEGADEHVIRSKLQK